MDRLLATTIILILALLGIGAAWLGRSRAPELPHVTERAIATFEKTFTVGFEGIGTEVTYSLKYPTDLFIVGTDPEDPRTIVLDHRATGAKHTITIFWNGAAGIENPEHYWNVVKPCPSCAAADAATSSNAQRFTYADATDEWAVELRQRQFFVISHFKKPSDETHAVWSTFRMSATPSVASSPR